MIVVEPKNLDQEIEFLENLVGLMEHKKVRVWITRALHDHIHWLRNVRGDQSVKGGQ